jgi:hypothetical protein
MYHMIWMYVCDWLPYNHMIWMNVCDWLLYITWYECMCVIGCYLQVTITFTSIPLTLGPGGSIIQVTVVTCSHGVCNLSLTHNYSNNCLHSLFFSLGSFLVVCYSKAKSCKFTWIWHKIMKYFDKILSFWWKFKQRKLCLQFWVAVLKVGTYWHPNSQLPREDPG